MEWLAEVIGEPSSKISDFAETLKNGVWLCRCCTCDSSNRAVNVVEPDTIRVDERDLKLVHAENVKSYLVAARRLGVPEFDLFSPADLYDKKNIPQVVQGVWSLVRTIQVS